MNRAIFEQKTWPQIWQESRPQDLWIVVDPVNSPWLSRLDWELNLLIRRQWPRAEKGRLLVATPPGFPARGVLVLQEQADESWEHRLSLALADAKALGVDRVVILATAAMKPTGSKWPREPSLEILWVSP
jgi:hypothetical protein